MLLWEHTWLLLAGVLVSLEPRFRIFLSLLFSLKNGQRAWTPLIPKKVGESKDRMKGVKKRRG